MKKSERNWTAFAFVSLPAFPFAACQHRNVAQEFFSHFWTKNIQFCWNFSRFRGEKNIKNSKFCCAPSPDCTVGQFTVGGRSGTFQQTCKSFPHAQTTWLYALQTVRVETNSATWIILFKGRHGRLDLRAQTDHQRNWGRVFLQPQDSLLLAPPPSAFFWEWKPCFVVNEPGTRSSSLTAWACKSVSESDRLTSFLKAVFVWIFMKPTRF